MNKAEWIDKLLLQYSKPMIQYAAAILRDNGAAKDVVQSCFIQLLNEPETKIHLHVQGWLFRQCRVRALAVWQKKHASESLDDTGRIPGFSTRPMDLPSELKNVDVLYREMEKLTSRHQEILWLKYHESLSYDQIAEILDLSPADAAALMYEAIDCMRESGDFGDTSRVISSQPSTEESKDTKRKW